MCPSLAWHLHLLPPLLGCRARVTLYWVQGDRGAKNRSPSEGRWQPCHLHQCHRHPASCEYAGRAGEGGERGWGGQCSSAAALPGPLLMASLGEVRYDRVTARGGEELSWTPRGCYERCQLKSVSVLSERRGPSCDLHLCEHGESTPCLHCLKNPTLKSI